MQQLFQEVLNSAYPQNSLAYFQGIVSIFESEEKANQLLENGLAMNPAPYTYYRNVTGGCERTDGRGSFIMTKRTGA